MKLSVTRAGVTLETSERQRFRNYEWAKPSMVFAWPGEMYLVVARRTISRLLRENREMRMRLQPTGSPALRALERISLAYLDRRYPLPSATPDE
jgi:hypothetical protein